jgi:polyphosphate kinase 2 (PPK2 family)
MKTDFKLSNLVFPEPLEKSVYKKQIDELQEKARLLNHYAAKKERGIIIVFEGWDAAGKGGSIRRLTSTMDPRLYHVVSVAAPTQEEKKRHYLWRFWLNLPRAGYTTIFDRSWYGRVLVERVEGFAKEEEWKRSYSEIISFEEDLADSGYIILKFWLHISSEEQLGRFNDRKEDPMKRWKLTEEDWRNREKWGFYETACEEMIEKTHTNFAPWIVVPSNDKYTARSTVLGKFCEIVEKELDLPRKFR